MCNKSRFQTYKRQEKNLGVIEVMIEERLGRVDFSQFSKVKGSLLFRLKLRRKAINEEMSLEELDEVAAAGNNNLLNIDDKKKF